METDSRKPLDDDDIRLSEDVDEVVVDVINELESESSDDDEDSEERGE